MTTIQVGVCGWGDQHELYVQGVRNRDKLSVYASHFPIVEVDSSFTLFYHSEITNRG